MYTLVMNNSVLSKAMLMVSYTRWGSFLDVVASGLQVKELWIKTVNLLLGLGVDPVVQDVGTSRFCRELGLLNGRHFDVVCLEEDA